MMELLTRADYQMVARNGIDVPSASIFTRSAGHFLPSSSLNYVPRIVGSYLIGRNLCPRPRNLAPSGKDVCVERML